MIRSTKDQVPYKSILLTSYAEFSYAKQAIDLKVSDYLMKPVEEEEIRKAIEKVTGEIRKEQEIAINKPDKVILFLPTLKTLIKNFKHRYKFICHSFKLPYSSY